MKSLCALLLGCGLALAQFSDVPPNHWAGRMMGQLVEMGIFTGYPDGTFQGQRAVTRYEATLILGRLLTTLDARILERASGLEDLQREVASITDSVQLALALVDDTIGRLEALEVRLITAEESLPSVLLVFDEVRNNLYQLERSFSAALLAQQSNILDEVDARLSELDTAFQQAVATFTDERIGQYDARVQGRLSEMRAQLAALGESIEEERRARAELSSQLERLNDNYANSRPGEEQNTFSWVLTLSTEVGVLGATPKVALKAEVSGAETRFDAHYDTGHLAVGAGYAFSDTLSLEGNYLSTEVGASAGVAAAAMLLPPLGLRVGVGYGNGIEAGLAFYHDPDHPMAVLSGLDLAASGRLALREGYLDSLIVVHARHRFHVGGVRVSPSFLYRRFDMPGGYSGFLGGLEAEYTIGSDLGLSGVMRYGVFTPLGFQGEPRSSPEVILGVTYRAFQVHLTLSDTILPPLTAHPNFNDASPLVGSGLKVGVRVGYTVVVGRN